MAWFFFFQSTLVLLWLERWKEILIPLNRFLFFIYKCLEVLKIIYDFMFMIWGLEMLSLTVKQNNCKKFSFFFLFFFSLCVCVCACTCIYGKFPPHEKSLVIYTFLLSNLRSFYNWVQNCAQTLTASPWRCWPYGNLTPDKSENFYFAF